MFNTDPAHLAKDNAMITPVRHYLTFAESFIELRGMRCARGSFHFKLARWLAVASAFDRRAIELRSRDPAR